MRVHLVDGTFELFRAHFSPRPDRPNKATVGILGSMLALLSDPDEKGDQVRIMTPDKDLGQVVSGKHVVQIDRMRRKEIDEDGVRAARGVGPESIPDLLGLVGDTADGIPGLPGFGAKSAAAVLARWKTI